jgi:hypothetical protein
MHVHTVLGSFYKKCTPKTFQMFFIYMDSLKIFLLLLKSHIKRKKLQVKPLYKLNNLRKKINCGYNLKKIGHALASRGRSCIIIVVYLLN